MAIAAMPLITILLACYIHSSMPFSLDQIDFEAMSPNEIKTLMNTMLTMLDLEYEEYVAPQPLLKTFFQNAHAIGFDFPCYVNCQESLNEMRASDIDFLIARYQTLVRRIALEARDNSNIAISGVTARFPTKLDADQIKQSADSLPTSIILEVKVLSKFDELAYARLYHSLHYANNKYINESIRAKVKDILIPIIYLGLPETMRVWQELALVCTNNLTESVRSFVSFDHKREDAFLDLPPDKVPFVASMMYTREIYHKFYCGHCNERTTTSYFISYCDVKQHSGAKMMLGVYVIIQEIREFSQTPVEKLNISDVLSKDTVRRITIFQDNVAKEIKGLVTYINSALKAYVSLILQKKTLALDMKFISCQCPDNYIDQSFIFATPGWGANPRYYGKRCQKKNPGISFTENWWRRFVSSSIITALLLITCTARLIVRTRREKYRLVSDDVEDDDDDDEWEDIGYQ